MVINTKIIKRRIKSVTNTKKITKAMELVSGAKMRKAVDAAVNTRAYATAARDLMVHLAQTEKTGVPLLAMRPVQKLLVVIVTSNRGMCGSFNTNIIRKTVEQLKHPENISRHRLAEGKEIMPNDTISIDVIGVGKKGAEFARKNGYNMIASYSEFPDNPTFNDVLSICKTIIDEYTNEAYDKVVVAYTDFKSALVQTPKLRQVLPVSEFDLEKMIDDLDTKHPDLEKKSNLSESLFEPDKTTVLNTVLPRLVETQIYQAVLESAASEHSARMMAMRSASDAADDMIDELSLNYNKARQAGITQEIAEIAGGAAAAQA